MTKRATQVAMLASVLGALKTQLELERDRLSAKQSKTVVILKITEPL